MPLKEIDLKVGRTFRAKRPRRDRQTGQLNDRTIIYLSLSSVQYDGPAVANGRHYPTVAYDSFLKRADREVTSQ